MPKLKKDSGVFLPKISFKSSNLISEIDEVCVQEMIDPVECVFKSYCVVGQNELRANNTIELQGIQDPGTIGKADVKKVVKPQMDELTHAVCYVVNDVLTKNGHTIFGIDFVRKVGTNDFYFFDINTDTISWGKLYPKDHYQIFIDSIHRLLGSK